MTQRRMIAVFKIICPFGSDKSCEEFLADLSQTMPLLPILITRLIFFLFYWFPFLIIFRFKRVIKLGEADCERYISWWEKNRFYFIREAFNSIKTVSLLARVGKEWEP